MHGELAILGSHTWQRHTPFAWHETIHLCVARQPCRAGEGTAGQMTNRCFRLVGH